MNRIIGSEAPLSTGQVFALSVGKAAGPIVGEMGAEERVEFWGDLLAELTSFAAAHIGAEHAQQLLCALRAPGAFTDN